MRLTLCVCLLCVCLCAVAIPPAAAQAPAPPHKIWDVTVSVGVATTSGNSDTSQFNAAYDLTYDPLTRNIVKTNALLLRGTTERELSAERVLFNVRDEYKISARAYVFGQNMYLRDKFKSISYLDAPSGGVGVKLVDAPGTKLDVDGGVGAVWEKNLTLALRKSGAVTAGERLQHQLTSTTSLTQSVTALWKTNDAEDALFTFGAGVAIAVSSRIQVKFEVLDVYKNKPPTPDFGKNDVATVVAIVFKS
jgi:putative salt-induced outer membrane protein YdiY